jgi:hypothetical protein
MGFESCSGRPDANVSDFICWLLPSVTVSYSGFSFVHADSLFISNLSTGIDLYSIRTLQRLRHYSCPVTINLPLQVTLACQGLDRVVMGGLDGIVRVYDRTTGELVHRLQHKAGGRVQVVDVSSSGVSHALTWPTRIFRP